MSKAANGQAGRKLRAQREIRQTVAARVSEMESEKIYLQNLHGDISRVRLSIGDRISALDRQIAAEKASVPNVKVSDHADSERGVIRCLVRASGLVVNK